MVGQSGQERPVQIESISGSGRLIDIGSRMILRLPESASAAAPSRGQVAIEGTVAGKPYVGMLEPDGLRGHWIDLTGMPEIGREETIDFDLHRCAQWPEPTIPNDMHDALESEKAAEQQWNDITPMARWEWVRWVGATKNPVTRAKRIEVTISKLLAGKRRPCCFDLSSCTDPELSKGGKLSLPHITES